jgi:hypothetical protein
MHLVFSFMNTLFPIFLLLLLTTSGAYAQVNAGVQAALSAIQAKVLHDVMGYGLAIGVIGLIFLILSAILLEKKRAERKRYYNEDYLQSDAWKRKRYVVLRRDKWTCVYCGDKATNVHHKRYARVIGNEPIDWLVSVCTRCHAQQHSGKRDKQN